MPAQVFEPGSPFVIWQPSEDWWAGLTARPRPLMDAVIKFDAVPVLTSKVDGGEMSMMAFAPEDHFVFVALDLRTATPIEKQAIAVLRGEDVELDTTLE